MPCGIPAAEGARVSRGRGRGCGRRCCGKAARRVRRWAPRLVACVTAKSERASREERSFRFRQPGELAGLCGLCGLGFNVPSAWRPPSPRATPSRLPRRPNRRHIGHVPPGSSAGRAPRGGGGLNPRSMPRPGDALCLSPVQHVPSVIRPRSPLCNLWAGGRGEAARPSRPATPGALGYLPRSREAASSTACRGRASSPPPRHTRPSAVKLPAGRGEATPRNRAGRSHVSGRDAADGAVLLLRVLLAHCLQVVGRRVLVQRVDVAHGGQQRRLGVARVLGELRRLRGAGAGGS